MKKNLALSLLLSSFGVAASSFAAQTIKPGLWEFTAKSDMFKNMPKMSAEQVEQMRKLGLQMPNPDQGFASKVCITKEMAERDTPPDMSRKEAGCQTQNYKHSGGVYSADIVCDGPDIKGTGKVQGTVSTEQSFSSTYDFKGTAHGHPVSHHTESTGKWLGADCGSVKPFDAATKKAK